MIRSTVIWIVTIVAVFLLVYVDWGKLLGKIKTKEVEEKVNEAKNIENASKVM